MALMRRPPFPKRHARQYHTMGAIFWLVSTVSIATEEHRLALPLIPVEVGVTIAYLALAIVGWRTLRSILGN